MSIAAMRGGDSTIATVTGSGTRIRSRRIRGRISQASDSDYIHQSKRLKRSSSDSDSAARSTRTTDIHDLPDFLLVEILSRLPCYKSVSQCKTVSKSWRTLISDPYFIGRFLYLQSDQDHHKQAPMSTVINTKGEEFLDRIRMSSSSSSSKPLTHQLFKRLVSFHGLKEDPVVLGTYNDLVLCCGSKYDQRDYFICNPYTIQWVPLPPPPQVYDCVPVGFICDLPYYNCKKDDDQKQGHIIQVNGEYRCKVVRLIFPDDQNQGASCEFKVQIFSTETGEWRESIVSSPKGFSSSSISRSFGFAYNKMLYWMSDEEDFLIGLDPFMIDNSDNRTSLSTADHPYKCCFIQCKDPPSFGIDCLGVYGGSLRMCDFDFTNNTLYIWELNEQEQEQKDDQTVMIHGGAPHMCLKLMRRDYFLGENFGLLGVVVDTLAFDPNNEDILYMLLERQAEQYIVACNFRTRAVSRVAGWSAHCPHCFPVVLPWWPTPVPRLPQNV